jgi:hypothetical protein
MLIDAEVNGDKILRWGLTPYCGKDCRSSEVSIDTNFAKASAFIRALGPRAPLYLKYWQRLY